MYVPLPNACECLEVPFRASVRLKDESRLVTLLFLDKSIVRTFSEGPASSSNVKYAKKRPGRVVRGRLAS